MKEKTKMPEERTFTVATDEALANLIQQARQRIVFIAPGISEAVAKALGVRLNEEDALSITVILDADPEVCRLGLGSLEGLTLLKGYSDQSCFALRCQPGVRIGVLIADDKTLIYSPTPLLVEAGSTSVEKPNAIMLTGADVKNIAVAAGADQASTPLSSEIGKQALTPKEIQVVEEDVKRNPPKPFDLARQANVFSSKLQYVEFEVNNYKISRKQAIIPTYLMGLDTQDLKWKNTVQVLDKESVTVMLGEEPDTIAVNPEYIEDRRKEIDKKFLYTIPNMGKVIFKSQQSEFEQELDKLGLLLDSYFIALQEQLKSRLSDIAKEISKQLFPKVKASPPESYLEFSKQITDADIQQFLEFDILQALDSSQILQQPKIRKVYKDISYQSFMNNDFLESLRTELRRKHVPEWQIKNIFKESLAVLEKGKSLF
ncbi:MAG TPA: hypothetical protein P5552_02495 [Candidatus Competibacteraceae bacterium]|nr:hypothetical protein [Candidatus Competibacteraceae bacterium]